MKGQVHSIETMGTMDGPGVRTVIFLQGCPLRCQYCHNPDTQAFVGGETYSVEDLLKIVKRYKVYYGYEGGVTFSGGEALMQGAFLLEAIKALKKEGIHVALDTSGIGRSSYFKEILNHVDLVLLDIKHYDLQAFKSLTSVSEKRLHAFFQALKDYKGKLWVRHVMVPGMTDSYSAMDKLGDYIKTSLPAIEKVEILPYHKLGLDKYSQLQLEYPLTGVPEMVPEQAKTYQDYINRLLFRQIAV